MSNNSISIMNEKTSIKNNNELLPYSQNRKMDNMIKITRNSVPSLYPNLFNNMNLNNNENNENNDDESKIRNNKISIDANKYKIEINPNSNKAKEGQINIIYKNKINYFHIKPNIKNNKSIKLRRDNSLKDSFGKYNKIFMKFHGDTDKFNLTNISFKEFK